MAQGPGRSAVDRRSIGGRCGCLHGAGAHVGPWRSCAGSLRSRAWGRSPERATAVEA